MKKTVYIIIICAWRLFVQLYLFACLKQLCLFASLKKTPDNNLAYLTEIVVQD